MRLFWLIVLGSIVAAANAQNAESRSFVLNESKPYAYITFDHVGKRKPLGKGETEQGLWLRFVNNCRVPLVIATFEPGTGDAGVGVFHDVVPYEAGVVRGIPGPQREAPSNETRQEPSIQVMNHPGGYSGEVSSTTTVGPGESVLFSVPSNHVSPNWYLRVRFTLAVSPTRIGNQPYSYADFRWEQLPDTAKERKE